MKVLLVSTNRSRNIMPPYPLGLALVTAGLDADRHTIDAWDAMFADDGEDELRGRLREFRPDVIGMSVRNVDDQEIRRPTFFLDEARRMAEACRQESHAALVLGGAGFSMFPEGILAALDADFGIVGEGERAFTRLLDRLEANESPDGIPGVVRLEGGRLRGAPPAWNEPLDGRKPADRDRWNANAYYAAPGTAGIPNVATLQSKRGCRLSCIYCSTAAIEGAAIRVRDPRAVVDEIEELRARGFERIHFVDSVFTNPPEHAAAIGEELLRRGVGVRWGCTINPAYAGRGLLGLLRRAGCERVFAGNESGCSRTLAALRKGFEREDVERCFTDCREEGLRINAFLMVGAPGEDRESVRESVDLLLRHRPDQVSVTVGIRIYPGCKLARIAAEEGVLAPDDNLLAPRFYLSPGLHDWIWEYLDPIVEREPAWSY